MAQRGLQIASLFDGCYHGRTDATEVVLKGRKLRPYHLTLFRSLTLKPSATEAADIERRVKQDVRNAKDKEVGMKGGRLYYGFYQLSGTSDTHRYLFYRNNALLQSSDASLTLIYMEGSATLDELRKHFGK